MRTNVRPRLPQFAHGPPPIGNPIENKEARSNWQAPDRSELVHASHGRVSLDWSIAPVHQVGNHDGFLGLNSRPCVTGVAALRTSWEAIKYC